MAQTESEVVQIYNPIRIILLNSFDSFSADFNGFCKICNCSDPRKSIAQMVSEIVQTPGPVRIIWWNSFENVSVNFDGFFRNLPLF